MRTAHALITGSNPDRLAVMRIIKTQLLRGVPPSLKPLNITTVKSATGNGGALPNTLREIGAIILGPSVQVKDKGKAPKLKGVTSWT